VTAQVLFLHGNQASSFGGETRWLLASFEQEWFHDAVEAAKQSQDSCQAGMEVGSSMGGWSS